jgi:hypothetical protein
MVLRTVNSPFTKRDETGLGKSEVYLEVADWMREECIAPACCHY